MRLSARRGASACAAALALASAAIASSAHGAASSAASTTAAPPAVDPGASLRARIEAARTRLLSHYRDVESRSGLADTLETRLDADEANLFVASKPENATAQEFWDWNTAIVTLDENLLDQLATGSYHPLGTVRGLDEILVPTHAAGSPAPCAVYVPSGYSPDRPAPLVVLLHAKGVSESVELAVPLFRALAAETGAIVIAPFARGDDLRTAQADADIYAALDAAEAALNVDRRRVYLVGDSLGGYAAFDVAPIRQSAWTALLAIRSTMSGTDQQAVKDHLRGKAVYIVAGSADDIVHVEDVRRSVDWFRSVGLATTYYEVPGAGHDIVALASSVQRAWRDMVGGVRNLQPPQVDVPSMTPPPSQHP